jgi:hypothetical protein
VVVDVSRGRPTGRLQAQERSSTVVQARPHGVSSGQDPWDSSSDGWTTATHVEARLGPAADQSAIRYEPSGPYRSDTYQPDSYQPDAYDPNGYRTAYRGDAVASPRRASRRERGLPGWLALIALLAIAGLGAFIDSFTSSSLRGGFNVGLVVASAVAILTVRRSAMFPIVIAPPIVYAVASGGDLYIHLNGASNRRALLIDAAANWLVYGFPAIAGATAVVLIVAGIRMVIRK